MPLEPGYGAGHVGDSTEAARGYLSTDGVGAEGNHAELGTDTRSRTIVGHEEVQLSDEHVAGVEDLHWCSPTTNTTGQDFGAVRTNTTDADGAEKELRHVHTGQADGLRSTHEDTHMDPEVGHTSEAKPAARASSI